MGDDPNGLWSNADSRWNPVVTTLDAFFSSPTSAGIYASLSFLPADGGNTAMCTPSNYSTGSSSIKVPLTLLNTAGSQKFLTRLCDPTLPQASTCIVPAGGTPTRPALQGTLDYAATVRLKYPGSKTVIVFLTDGEPGFGYLPTGSTSPALLVSCDDLNNGCIATIPLNAQGPFPPPCVRAQDEVDKVTAVIAGAPPQSIYLFGVGDLLDTTLSDWGGATGNPAVDLRGMTGADAANSLKTALDNIRTTSISCNFTIPPPSGNAPIDPTKVSFKYIGGNGTIQTVGRTHDGTAATCNSSQLGWYFDNPGAPKEMNLCASTCTALQNDPNGQIQIVYGCTPMIF
jgi:hypothetical protein